MSEETLNDASDTSSLTSSSGTVAVSAATLLGADLVVVALAWDNPPSEGGIITITFLMMISFVAFINVLHQLMRFEYIASNLKLKEPNEEVFQEINI